MIKKAKKIIMLLFIITIILLPNYKVEAKTLQDLHNELAELKKKQESALNNQHMTTEQIDNLNREINTVESNIENTKKEIDNATKKISDSEKEIAEKKEETDELLKFLQISSGENVYLEYIFESDSYTDFIYRYSIVSQLTEYNNNLMEELKILINELEESKVTLANKEKELESQKKSLSSKMSTLKANLSEIIEEGTTIAEDIESKQKDIDYYTSKGCKLNQELNSCVNVPNANGWNLPIIGSAYVTSEYQVVRTDCYGCGGTSHRGIDLGVSEGTKVYAAAKGRVAYTVSRSSCGGNMVYIYHTVNGEPYTTVYMHLLEIYAKPNQIVDSNTVIGISGGGTTSAMSGCRISPYGYDRCTCGAHLHFGVATGNDVSAFNANSFDPRNLTPFVGGSYLKRL